MSVYNQVKRENITVVTRLLIRTIQKVKLLVHRYHISDAYKKLLTTLLIYLFCLFHSNKMRKKCITKTLQRAGQHGSVKKH